MLILPKRLQQQLRKEKFRGGRIRKFRGGRIRKFRSSSQDVQKMFRRSSEEVQEKKPGFDAPVIKECSEVH
eukprot:scaffold462_cov195-Pinguiococcus_pyrenoidosus.AAC.53